MIAWPDGVNQTVLQDTSGKFRAGTIGDSMRSGRKKTRLLSTTSPKPASVIMVFTRDEFAIFESWYEINLRFGALSFSFPKIAGTGNAEYRIVDQPAWVQYGANTLKVTMSWEEQ